MEAEILDMHQKSQGARAWRGSGKYGKCAFQRQFRMARWQFDSISIDTIGGRQQPTASLPWPGRLPDDTAEKSHRIQAYDIANPAMMADPPAPFTLGWNMMNFPTGIARSLTLLCAVTAAGIAHADAQTLAQTFIDNGELNYVGSLSDEANRRAFALYDAALTKPAVLAIRSKGGVTGAGIELGNWVHARKLTVKVMEYCFSSCANYVFTAAPRKVVSNFAVIGYHGGLSSASFDLDDETQAMLAAMPAEQRQMAHKSMQDSIQRSLAKEREAEAAFFARIGVAQRITTLGQEGAAPAADRDKSVGWTYSLAGFSRLGVASIDVINPPWRPGFVNTDAQVTLIDVP